MKWPLRYDGTTYLRKITDTVQTVQYSDSHCTQQQYWHECRRCSWLHAGLYWTAPQPFTIKILVQSTDGIDQLHLADELDEADQGDQIKLAVEIKDTKQIKSN